MTNFANLVPIGSPTCLQQLIEQPSTLLPPIGGSSTQMLPPQQSARDDSATAIEPEDIPTDDYPALPHVIVIYVVNPFTFGHEFRHPMMMRLSMLAITRYVEPPSISDSIVLLQSLQRCLLPSASVSPHSTAVGDRRNRTNGRSNSTLPGLCKRPQDSIRSALSTVQQSVSLYFLTFLWKKAHFQTGTM